MYGTQIMKLCREEKIFEPFVFPKANLEGNGYFFWQCFWIIEVVWYTVKPIL